jgi:hypothetical protein
MVEQSDLIGRFEWNDEKHLGEVRQWRKDDDEDDSNKDECDSAKVSRVEQRDEMRRKRQFKAVCFRKQTIEPEVPTETESESLDWCFEQNKDDDECVVEASIKLE